MDVSKGCSLALLAAISAALAAPTTVHAQDAAAPLEEIQVTGSRIKRQDLEAVGPVTVFDAQAYRRDRRDFDRDIVAKVFGVGRLCKQGSPRYNPVASWTDGNTDTMLGRHRYLRASWNLQ